MLADTYLKRGTEVKRSSLHTLNDWYPVAIDVDTETTPAALWWRCLGQRRLTAAFFEDNFAAQSAAERRVCRTPLSVLGDLPAAVPPTAFIFHVSRCGSTLLSQMLTTLAHCIVVSEPPVLDAFFRLHQQYPQRSGGAHTLRLLIAALGQRRYGESHFFVKLDSWHMPWLAWLRQVFPATPFVLLYRDPVQVLESHRRQRGAHMVPGLVDVSRLELDTSGLAPGELEGYGERVLTGVFNAAVASAAAQNVRLLNYEQLPSIVWTDLLGQWGVPCSGQQRSTLQARAGFHAKQSNKVYAGDQAPPAPPAATAPTPTPIPTQSVALSQALAAYAGLEALRRNCRLDG